MTVTVSTQGSGLAFVNTYGVGCTAAFEACIVAAEKQLESLFGNNLTVNVTFKEVNRGSGGVLGTNDFGTTNVTYAQLKGALPSSDVLPSQDPNPTGGKDWSLPTAYARMLGLSNSSSSVTNDTVNLNSFNHYDYGQDVINIIEHELSEGCLGRIGNLGTHYSTMDLFRYNGAGKLDDTNGTDGQKTYFSSDGGATSSSTAGLSFHNQYTSPTSVKHGGDVADFSQLDVFGTGASGETLTLSQTDLDMMTALGWKLTLPQEIFTLPEGESSGNWQTPKDWSVGSMPITVEDVLIGVLDPGVTAISNNKVTVNSIATVGGCSLIIGDDSTLTATNGTVLNPKTTITWDVTGNIGTVEVDAGSKLAIGNTFDNMGTLDVGQSSNGNGVGTLALDSSVTLDGGGTVNLGNLADQSFSAGAISGGGLINVDNTIIGGGSINLTSFDNQSKGVVDASQSEGNSLSIDAKTFTNEGELNVETRATLDLGADGATNSLTDAGTINIGWDGSAADEDAQLAISGVMTIAGAGDVAMKGAGARLTSDGEAAAKLINECNIQADASGQIGDVGVYGAGVNDLTFENLGTTSANGNCVTLTLATGGNTIDDGGGTLLAENGATLKILSNVTTGEIRLNVKFAPPGGTIEAASGGTVKLSASVTDGVETPFQSVAGQVVVAAGGLFEVLSGGSVAVPVKIDGTDDNTTGGVFEVLKGGSLTGDVAFESAGATLKLNHTASIVDLNGSGGTIDLGSADISVAGSSDFFDFAAKFGKDEIKGFVSSDTIHLMDFGSWHALQPHLAQSGANTTITLNSNNVITLLGVTKSSLTSSEFTFV